MTKKYEAQNQAQAIETTLSLLDAVADSDKKAISQRNIAERLDIALGLTNAVLKRCVKKGFLKIREAPARRYAYYLTPQGFTEKTRLTAEFLSFSLCFYRSARQEFSEIFAYCEMRGLRSVVLVGATDLAEIGILATLGTNLTVTGVLDPTRNESSFNGLPVYRTVEEITAKNPPDIFVLSDITNPQSTYDQMVAEIDAPRILVPKLLRVLKKPDHQAPEVGGAW